MKSVKMRGSRTRRVAILALVTAAFAVSLLACEFGARAYVRLQGIGRQELLLEQGSLFLPDPELMYRYRPSQFYSIPLQTSERREAGLSPRP